MRTAATSFYEATVERPERPALHGAREQAEVCIVGGGFAGLATALGLVERGTRDVVVLEAQRVGFGASGRNGGFVFGGYSLECADLLRLLGEKDARALYRLTLDAVELIGARIARHAIDCDVVNAGIVLADWFGRPQSLEAQRQLMQRSFGVEWEPVSKSALRDRLKTDRYHGGLLERHGFHFHPLKYALGIAKTLTDAAVRIYEHSAAVKVEREHDGYLVSTTNGSIRARHVVMAVGGYGLGLYPQVERAVLPIATYVVTTQPLGARLTDAIDCASAVYDTRFAFDYYRALPDTRILWGGRISIFERDPRTIAKLLMRDLLRVYPQLEGIEIEHAWGGLMSYARHKMPQIGRCNDGIWHAVGFGGHGVAPTTAAGEVLAAAIAEGRPIPAAFARFGLEPTHGILGLAAAELTYLTKIAGDAIAERRKH
ncbi:FAD-dependent oxidoreductase [Trinickia dabaoshanensis]|uniref:FAD-dependent oxidoreductase n=1 Tax=Trinickia dabaoshanensis TaxID=564714 RepID=A0A2N7VY79_9BURK|nr:FAD-binding oxidoreductase [Trinickia dabaoshanensis]PMS22103.1 FAD-dependent oxidoreductase [Trinickia dabaoshanensis]